MNVDPSGHLATTIVAGAAFGFIIGGGANIAEQLILNDGNLSNIALNEVFANALTGAVSGALMGSGVGYLGSIFGNAAISGANYAATQFIRGDKINARDAARDTFIGGVAGIIGGAGALYGESGKIINNAKTTYNLAKFLGLKSGQVINRDIIISATTKSMAVSVSRTIIGVSVSTFQDKTIRRKIYGWRINSAN